MNFVIIYVSCVLLIGVIIFLFDRNKHGSSVEEQIQDIIDKIRVSLLIERNKELFIFHYQYDERIIQQAIARFGEPLNSTVEEYDMQHTVGYYTKISLKH